MAKKPEDDTFIDMFNVFGRQMKVPSMDIEAVLEHHRKNLEALQKSAAANASGTASILAKQRDMLQEQMREIADMAQSYRSMPNAQETMNKHAEFVRRSFETTVKNASELTQLAQKSGTESIEILRRRIADSMQEIRSTYDKNR